MKAASASDPSSLNTTHPRRCRERWPAPWGDDPRGLRHEATDAARIVVREPLPAWRQGLTLTVFTGRIPGIELGLANYLQELPGVQAREEGSGAFRSTSPSVSPAGFNPASLTCRDVHEGGEVNGLGSLEGVAPDDLPVPLGEAGFADDRAPFAGGISSSARPAAASGAGTGRPGAASATGGTFGLAAGASSLSVPGAFTACACASRAAGRWRSTARGDGHGLKSRTRSTAGLS